MQPIIPSSILNRIIPLPCDPHTPAHAKEPETLGLHRMLGYADQADNRSIKFLRDEATGSYSVLRYEQADCESVSLAPTQILAAASYLQGHVLTRTLKLVKSMGDLDGDVLRGIVDDATRQLLNAMNDDIQRYPWAGVGVVPCSPDGEEFALARKDHLHPCAGYCNRLAFIGGGMDPNEVLSGWGSEPDCAYVAMLRECYEEIRVPEVAVEIAESVTNYRGACKVRCHLYEDDGYPTDGVLRVFLARAPSQDAWDRWRKIFTKEVDGLGEANPELITRSQLLEACRADIQMAAHRYRQVQSVTEDRPLLSEEEAVARKRFSRKSYTDKLEWRKVREAAQAAGEFPLRHRGNFFFIGGVGHALNDLLYYEGLH